MDQAQLAAFGRRVKEARRSRGMNQAQLAEAANIAVNTVSAIEQGKHAAHPSSLAAVMDALGLEPSTEVERAEVPEDVRLVTQVVEMWLTGIPAGEERAAAVLGLVRYLGAPAGDPSAPVLDRTPGRGRGSAKDVRNARAEA